RDSRSARDAFRCSACATWRSRNRWKGVRPQSRGVAMNPVDHPLGGGEGKTSGGRPAVSPWGKPERRTRKKSKASQQFIVRRRRSGKARG
ncbi:MAG: hypothetical protein ACKO8V_09310, partial [Actinomycetota bacterium]